MSSACPHCGDTRLGYQYSVLAHQVYIGSVWGDEDSIEAGELNPLHYPKTVVCSACNRRVNRTEAKTPGNDYPLS